MRPKSFLLVLCAWALFCTSCNPDLWSSTEWFINFQNDSSENIWVTTGCKKENGKIYLTTEFPLGGDINKIFIESGNKGHYTKKPYRDVVQDDNALFAIFIISDEVYNSYSWEEIGEKELFLKKYIFRYGDMPFTPIIYPHDYD